MRLLVLLAGLWFAATAHAQGLAGTYAMQGQDGPIVVRIQVSGTRLIGTLDAPDSNTIVLLGSVTGGRARGTVSSVGGAGEFEASVEGDTLRLTLSQRRDPARRPSRCRSSSNASIRASGLRPAATRRLPVPDRRPREEPVTHGWSESGSPRT